MPPILVPTKEPLSPKLTPTRAYVAVFLLPKT
jgi:hypothetical protein